MRARNVSVGSEALGSRGALGLIVLLGGLTGALASCAMDAQPGTEYEISGYVRSEPSGRFASVGIGSALVRFVSDTGRVHEARTDGSGRYEMLVFSDTRFGQVRAEAEGFEPAETTVYFDTRERRIDLSLRRTPD